MANLVELPLHLYWSEPRRAFDLDDHKDLLQVYETVMREGSTEDVRRFVDPATVLDLWDELVLPRGVEGAWHDYFRLRGQQVRRRWCSPPCKSA